MSAKSDRKIPLKPLHSEKSGNSIQQQRVVESNRDEVDESAMLSPSSPVFTPEKQLFLYSDTEKALQHLLKFKAPGALTKDKPSSPTAATESPLGSAEDEGGEDYEEGKYSLPTSINRRHPFRHLRFWRVIFWVQFSMILAIFLFVVILCVLSGFLVYYVKDLLEQASEALRNNPVTHLMDKFRSRGGAA